VRCGGRGKERGGGSHGFSLSEKRKGERTVGSECYAECHVDG
jgi:hypothetical protein